MSKKNIRILIQVGKLGSSIIDHLISPIAKVDNVEEVRVFCRQPGPVRPKIIYNCPPGIFARHAFIGVCYEYVSLLLYSFSKKYKFIGGYLLWPHGIVTYLIGKLFRKKIILSMIAGIPELYTRNSIEGINFEDPPPLYGKISLVMLKKADAVITTGSVTKKYLVEHGVNSEKIFAIIHPANKERFYPVESPKKFDVISVAFLDEIKHTEILLYAIAEAKKTKRQIKACIVGDGVRMAFLTDLVKKLGIQDNIYFAGYQKDVPFFLNRSKIFLHSSEREGFPNVYLEAMLCGLPGIVSNCGDIMDIARDGVNSIVIQNYKDYKGFSKAIITLLNNPELYNRMSKNALSAMEDLSEDKVVQTWKQVLVT
ncbi:MAG: glycosyltransferase family 4 protein [Chitinispirillaceae bacterium]|nr:glycosyltransferase family 4 protein [Chitinispirillaceae bacterium]